MFNCPLLPQVTITITLLWQRVVTSSLAVVVVTVFVVFIIAVVVVTVVGAGPWQLFRRWRVNR